MGDEESGQPLPPAGKTGGADSTSPPAAPPVRDSPHVLSTDKPRSASVARTDEGNEGISSYCDMGMTMTAGKKGTYLGYTFGYWDSDKHNWSGITIQR